MTITLKDVTRFCKSNLAGLFDVGADLSPIYAQFNFDILAWLDDQRSAPLSQFAVPDSVACQFEYNTEQLKTRKDQFARYGNDVNALSKIMTRISSLESQFRQVRVGDNPVRGIFNFSQDAMTKYTLAN